MLAFSSYGAKDSSTFAGEIDEFVWNLATYELREADERDLGAAAARASEFERAGLEMAPSRLVAPPRVAAAPARWSAASSTTSSCATSTGARSTSTS